MEVTLAGMVREVSPVQESAPVPMAVTPAGMVREVSPVQSENA